MNSGTESQEQSPFVTPVAVEAWDTWFRWRENGRLRDDTVEATWRRVAATLASVEDKSERSDFERALIDAFASWRLLLDEKVLAAAGTGVFSWSGNDLVAALNVTAFVRVDRPPQATIDWQALKDCAYLAVHALDNAIILSNNIEISPKKLRIGIVGLADTLTLLDVDYGSPEACALAQSIAQALAEGCLRATIDLAEMRGSTAHCDQQWIEKARQRGTSEELLDRAQRSGLRHSSLTSITSQPKLARFANDVSDAVLPRAADDAFTRRSVRSKTSVLASVPSQLDIRGAMQPWIDEPIASPVRSEGKPAPINHLDWYARAIARGLGALSWNQ